MKSNRRRTIRDPAVRFGLNTSIPHSALLLAYPVNLDFATYPFCHMQSVGRRPSVRTVRTARPGATNVGSSKFVGDFVKQDGFQIGERQRDGEAVHHAVIETDPHD